MAQVPADRSIEEIEDAIGSVARVMGKARVHERLLADAQVTVDRAGAALLYKLHVEGADLRLTDLADRLGIDAPAVSRKVQQLEQGGLVHRISDPQDRRALRLRLTREGTTTIECLLAARRKWLEGLLTGWSTDEKAAFAQMLRRFACDMHAERETDHGD